MIDQYVDAADIDELMTYCMSGSSLEFRIIKMYGTDTGATSDPDDKAETYTGEVMWDLCMEERDSEGNMMEGLADWTFKTLEDLYVFWEYLEPKVLELL